MTTLDFRLSRRARTALLVPTLMLPASAAAQDPVTTLDSVTVTATRTETTALDAPAAITVIGRDEIDRTQATSLDDAIRHVPGVEMSGGPRASAEQANIRGMGGTRVVVRTDGVRKNFESGHRGRIFQDLDLVEQIDILRGPSSMLYGSGAIGGVINIETKDARDLLEPGQTVGAQVKTGFQSNASHRHGSITAYAAPSDHVDFLVSGSRRSAGDAETGDGRTIAFSNDSSAAGLAKATISGRGHGVEVTAQRYQLWNEIPTAANDGTSTTVADRTLREASGSLRYTFDAPDSDLIDVAASVYASDTRIKEQLLSNGRDDRTELMTVGLDVANTSRFELSDTLGLALTIGGEAYQDEQSGYRNGAPRAQYPGAEATTQAGFVQGEFTLFDRLSLTPGLRLDHYERDASGQRSVAEDELSKKLAVSYDVTSSLEVAPLIRTVWRPS